MRSAHLKKIHLSMILRLMLQMNECATPSSQKENPEYRHDGWYEILSRSWLHPRSVVPPEAQGQGRIRHATRTQHSNMNSYVIGKG